MKIPPELQAEMYQMLLRFREHRNGRSGYILPSDSVYTVPCPRSADYLQYAEERGIRCNCGADDVQQLLAKIDECLKTDTTYGNLA